MTCTRLIVLILLITIIAGLPIQRTLAQGSEPVKAETCVEQPEVWKLNKLTILQDGACRLNGGSLSYSGYLMDFHLMFKFKITEGEKIAVEFGQSIFETYRLEITQSSANLTLYTGNPQSSVVHDRVIINADITIAKDEWNTVDFFIEGREIRLNINEAQLWKAGIDRMVAELRIEGNEGTAIDDLSIQPLDLSTSGESLDTYSQELLKTWIAYSDWENSSWLIHPDGSGRIELKRNPDPRYWQRFLFSPDGRYLAVLQRGENEGELSFFDTENLQSLPSIWMLSRETLFDWLPDSRRLIYLQEFWDGFYELVFIHISRSANERRIDLSSLLAEAGLTNFRVSVMRSSPVDDVVFFAGYYSKNSTTEGLQFLLDLNSSEMTLLTYGGDYFWAPDGKSLIATAGGIVTFDPLRFQEWSQIYGPEFKINSGLISPNGQFLGASAGQSQLGLFDRETQQIIKLSRAHGIVWAPDSQHFVYSDSGRIVVQEVFSKGEIQIAEGNNPAWQPDLAIREKVRVVSASTPVPSPTVPSSTVTPVPEKVLPGLATEVPQIVEAGIGTEDKSASPKSFFSVLLILLGSAFLLGSFFMLFFSRSVKCLSCGGKNTNGSAFCMFCGKPLQMMKSSPRYVLLGLSAGALIFISVGITLQKNSYANANPTHIVQVLDQRPTDETALSIPVETPVLDSHQQPVESSQQSEQQGCNFLNKGSIRLDEVYQHLESSRHKIEELGAEYQELIAPVLASQHTPEPGVYEEIQKIAKELGEECTLSSISVSPNGENVLITFSSGSDSRRMAMFGGKDYKLTWSTSIGSYTPQFYWSPDVSKIAVVSGNSISVIAEGSGEILSEVNPSTRQGGVCDLSNSSDAGIRWMSDSQTILRKIENAIQFLDSEKGSVLAEVPTSDGQMGNWPLEGRANCAFRLYWSPDASQFITIGAHVNEEVPGDNRTYYYPLKRWEVSTGNLLQESRIKSPFIANVAWLFEQQMLLYTGSSSTYFEIRNLAVGASEGERVHTPGDGFRIGDFLPQEHGPWVAIQTDGKVWVYNTADGSWTEAGGKTFSEVRLNAWLPGGNRLLIEASPEAQSPMFFSSDIRDYWIFHLPSGEWLRLENMKDFRGD